MFGVPLVIQMTDDEKFLWKRDEIPSTHDAYEMTRQNARDIIAIGFDPTKTFIFSDLHYVGRMWANITSLARLTSANSVKAVFGFTGQRVCEVASAPSHHRLDSMNIGQFHFPAVQAAPSFSSSFPHIFGADSNLPCLIPCAIDQDPYFRLTREVAPKLGYRKPALLHSKFFPALQGAHEKMSASSKISAVYLTDTPEEIYTKVLLEIAFCARDSRPPTQIKEHAFSGGKDSAEEQRRTGANLSVDVSIAYLEFFMEDDAELARIKDAYGSGKMLTDELKDILIRVMVDVVQRHQRYRRWGGGLDRRTLTRAPALARPSRRR